VLQALHYRLDPLEVWAAAKIVCNSVADGRYSSDLCLQSAIFVATVMGDSIQGEPGDHVVS
jgi:hypothetical protein